MRFAKVLSILMALAIVVASTLPVTAQGRGGGSKGGGGKTASAAAKSGSKQSAKVAAKKDGSQRHRLAYSRAPRVVGFVFGKFEDGMARVFTFRDRVGAAVGEGNQVRAKKEFAAVPSKAKAPVKASTAVKAPVTATPPLAKGSTIPSTTAPPSVMPKPLGPIKPPPGVVHPTPKYPLHPAYPSAKYPLHGHRFWKHQPWIYGGGGSSSIVNVYGDFDVGCAECGCEIVAVIDESDTCVDPSVAILAAGGAYDLVVVSCPGDEGYKTLWVRR